MHYQHVKAAAARALDAAKFSESREEIQNLMNSAYRLLANCIEKEFAIRNDTELNPRRNRRGEVLKVVENDVGDFKRRDFESCAKALAWVARSLNEVRQHLWKKDVKSALDLYEQTFEGEPV